VGIFVADLEKHDFSDVIFHTGKGTAMTFKDLSSNGFVIGPNKVDVDGILDGPYTKKVTVRHFVGGKLVELTDVQATQGEFSTSFVLRQGRNTLCFALDKAQGEELQFDVFCKSSLREWAENIVKALILVILVKTFVVQAFYIPTGSMRDTLDPGDYILVDKVSFLFSEPATSDIIVFQYPMNFTQDFIKRLVGQSHDVLEMRNKELLRNDQAIEEPFAVHKDFKRFLIGPWRIRDNWGPLEVPEDHVFAMGDNRDYSQDSRFWGPLPKFRLKGKAFLVYFPLKRFGLIGHGKASSPSSAP